jgi:hypothetical protein
VVGAKGAPRAVVAARERPGPRDVSGWAASSPTRAALPKLALVARPRLTGSKRAAPTSGDRAGTHAGWAGCSGREWECDAVAVGAGCCPAALCGAQANGGWVLCEVNQVIRAMSHGTDRNGTVVDARWSPEQPVKNAIVSFAGRGRNR